jgi:predicted DNA-binding protein with PD1-like motif
MKSKPVATHGEGRNFLIVMETGEDVVKELARFLLDEHIASAELTGIGGFRRATLGYYDMDDKRYVPIEVDEQVELVSLIGNITSYNGASRLHAHCAVGHRNASTSSGHLLAATVRPTLELMVRELTPAIVRVDRPDVGIPLIDLDAET